MKKTTKCIAILLALMTLVNLTPVTVRGANLPYCRISYDSSVGCSTNKYYYYNKNNVACYDAARLVKFYDSKILLGTSNTLVTSKHKSGTYPVWVPDGSYLVWQENDNSLNARNFATGQNFKLADNITSIGINTESMGETVTFSDGKSVTIASLFTGANVPAPTPKPSTPAPAPAVKKLNEYTDSKGREIFEFGKNKVMVDKKDVYFNDFKISEVCNSGVRFLGITTSYNVYLYEDESESYYKFSEDNIFVPEKLQFPNNGKLISVNNDPNTNFLKEIVTTTGTFKPSELTKTKKWKPAISYAINKEDYCTYYIKGTTKKYTLTRKGTSLYLGKKKIAKGIDKGKNAFGFKDKKLYYRKDGKIREATIKKPKKSTIVKDFKKITFSKKNGQVVLKK